MIQRITDKPPRFHQDNALYFLTFCTFHRKPLLHQSNIPEMLIENLKFYSCRLQQLIAYTIMPDHVHLLVEVEDSNTLSVFSRDFKKRSAKEIKRQLFLTSKHIWQRGTMDHCIRFSWTNEDFHNHVQYLYFNSFKHLGIFPKDFPYHNFKIAVEQGWLDEDFWAFDESKLIHHKIYE